MADSENTHDGVSRLSHHSASSAIVDFECFRIWLAGEMLVSRNLRHRPADKPMPKATARADARKSSIRARVEHVFADQKNRIGLFMCSIGIDRTITRIDLVNMAYNMGRLAT